MKVNKGKQKQPHNSSIQTHAVLKTSEERYCSIFQQLQTVTIVTNYSILQQFKNKHQEFCRSILQATEHYPF